MRLIMNIRIIPLEYRHVEVLAALEQVCFGADAWSAQSIADEVENDAARFFVAESEEGDVCGYIGMLFADDFACVCDVAVAPEYRRRGIAQMLIKRLFEECRGLGVAQLSLEARVSNAPAIALYKKMGFVSMGIRPNVYENPHESAIVMNIEIG